MNTLKLVAMTLGLAALMATSAQAQNTYTIGVDVSRSSLIITNQTYARNAAEKATAKLADLKLGDRVVLRTLGDYGGNKGWRLDVTASKKHRPRKVRAAVKLLIGAIPESVRQGKINVGGSTNIIGFIDNAGGALGCNRGGRLILISDGQENSELVNGSAIVRGAAELPQHGAANVRGCQITMLGLGDMANESSLKKTLNIRSFWTALFENRGAHFTSLTAF